MAYKGLVIVESPTKVKKISGFLGKDYKVMASVGHVRDLPSKAAEIPAKYKKESWATLGVDVENDFSPLYVISTGKKKVVQEIKKAAESAKELIIATDEDREGESIGWHLIQILKPKIPVKRMTFSEITKSAVTKAINETREINVHLVNAQETRRILDRLYGYTLSPLLWKKVARGLSAGRVQSPAVRLLVEREIERKNFRSGSYWDLKAKLEKQEGSESFEAELSKVKDKRVARGKDFDENTGELKPEADVVLINEEEAKNICEQLKAGSWKIANIEDKAQIRKPYAPFTTSSLQQEGNRKLGFTARRTMQVAQRLYENGHITYMRTDSVSMSSEAVEAIRASVKDRYGDDYLSPEVRQFKTKSKAAQEAHEAIRPAGTEMKTGEELGLQEDELKLYTLIWQRAMSTQMADARIKFQTIYIEVGDAEFRASGKTIMFPGFFRAYVEGSDDPDSAMDDREKILPKLSVDEILKCLELDPVGHETKPPARYTEASLVKALEEKGIGRPSTYATIIGTIQDRGYCRKVGSQLIPTYTAMAVTQLMERHFLNLIDYNFTAKMEDTLDNIASGEEEYIPYLKSFYSGDNGLNGQVKTKEENIDPKKACTLQFQGMDYDIRVGRYGPYFEKGEGDDRITASIPEDVAPSDITNEIAQEILEAKERGPQSLGVHPEEGLDIFVLRGPFGPYVQLGPVVEDGPKPKRVGIPKTIEPSEITLEQAIALLGLPRRLGHHPETSKVVNAGIGRFGPYVVHEGKYKSLGKDYDVLTIDLETAVELLKTVKPKAAPEPLKELGEHPDGGKVGVYEGRYGPYVKYKKINATIPKDQDPSSVTLEEALEWIAAKAAKKKTTRKKK